MRFPRLEREQRREKFRQLDARLQKLLSESSLKFWALSFGLALAVFAGCWGVLYLLGELWKVLNVLFSTF